MPVFLLWPPASLPRGANRGILAALPKQPAVNKAMHITVISNIHSHNIHQDDTDNALAASVLRIMVPSQCRCKPCSALLAAAFFAHRQSFLQPQHDLRRRRHSRPQHRAQARYKAFATTTILAPGRHTRRPWSKPRPAGRDLHDHVHRVSHTCAHGNVSRAWSVAAHAAWVAAPSRMGMRMERWRREPSAPASRAAPASLALE